MHSTTQHRSEIAGLRIIEAGEGHPVLLLHGVGLRAEAWNAQMEFLSSDHHVIAPDMAGHGLSPRAPNLLTVADYALACLPLLQSLPERVLIVGHSMGAMIALELASSAPQRVSGVVALNAIFERSAEATEAVQTRANDLDGINLPDPEPTLKRWFGDTESTERTACESWLRSADPMGYKQAYMAFAHANGPSQQALETLSCPALFATGANEPNSTPAMSRAMAAIAPRGHAIIIDDAAHMMPMTHAREVNSALLNVTRKVWP